MQEFDITIIDAGNECVTIKFSNDRFNGTGVYHREAHQIEFNPTVSKSMTVLGLVMMLRGLQGSVKNE